MDNKDAIKARIVALRAKTVANGCTEAEAMAALEMASKLMAKYAIAEDEIGTKKDEWDGVEFHPHDIGIVRDGVSILYDTQYLIEPLRKMCGLPGVRLDGRILYAFGDRENAATFFYLLDMLESVAQSEFDAYWKQRNYQELATAPQGPLDKLLAAFYGRNSTASPEQVRESWMVGYCIRVQRQIESIIARRDIEKSQMRWSMRGGAGLVRAETRELAIKGTWLEIVRRKGWDTQARMVNPAEVVRDNDATMSGYDSANKVNLEDTNTRKKLQ